MLLQKEAPTRLLFVPVQDIYIHSSCRELQRITVRCRKVHCWTMKQISMLITSLSEKAMNVASGHPFFVYVYVKRPEVRLKEGKCCWICDARGCITAGRQVRPGSSKLLMSRNAQVSFVLSDWKISGSPMSVKEGRFSGSPAAAAAVIVRALPAGLRNCNFYSWLALAKQTSFSFQAWGHTKYNKDITFQSSP